MNYQRKANLTLGIIFISYLSISILNYRVPNVFGIKLIHFVLEAAFIGGIADWFAVTALFTKPLGWPWHTAIIPRNREKVINGVAEMVQKDLLSLDLVKNKLEDIDISQRLINWTDSAVNWKNLSNNLTLFLLRWLRKQNPERLTRTIRDRISNQATRHEVYPKIINAFQEYFRSANNSPIDKVLDGLISKVLSEVRKSQVREMIYNFLDEQKNKQIDKHFNKFLISFLEMTGGLDLSEASYSFHNQLIASVEALKDNEHSLRNYIKESFWETIHSLQTDVDKQLKLISMRKELQELTIFQDILNDLITSSLNYLKKPQENISNTHEGSELQQLIGQLTEQVWITFKNSDVLQIELDEFIKEFLIDFINKKHFLIGTIVKNTLENLSNDDLNQFIQVKAGNDLQWIRINGSVIGGLVGFFLFLFLNFVYTPLIPYLTNWLM